MHLRAGQLQGRPDRRAPGLSAGAWQMRPLSRGYVVAKSNRPGDMPTINPRYLSEEPDRRAIVGGLRLARRLFAAPVLRQFVREESLPGIQVQTDDELLDYARRNGGTCYHASCTCLMGSHAMAVVDDELRVHGLDGLRVIEASVTPAVTSTNTNAPRSVRVTLERRMRNQMRAASDPRHHMLCHARGAVPEIIDVNCPVLLAEGHPPSLTFTYGAATRAFVIFANLRIQVLCRGHCIVAH
jgi:hypothetical protein